MASFNKHIVIVGTARSGTSWLSETIASQQRYRMLFEPEHETQTKKGHLLCDQWITNQNVTRDARNYLRQVFKNQVDSDWIAQNSNRKFKRHLWPFIPKKFVIKFVRGNLLAQFINESFGIPVVHLLRNPYEVISSQQKVKFPWLYDLSRFAQQPELTEILRNQFDVSLKNLGKYKPVELLTYRWCIENVLPIERFPSYKNHVKVVRYEELFSDINVFLDLCKAFDIEPVSNISERYKRPSSKTLASDNILKSGGRSSGLSSEDLNRVNNILDQFQSTLYPRQ
ncbi:MAG: sulfotransferase domain-containing protein [Psychroserpens sp.]|nr:sulfotransferase domain-containing protein [Psychroserpens sp.]